MGIYKNYLFKKLLFLILYCSTYVILEIALTIMKFTYKLSEYVS